MAPSSSPPRILAIHAHPDDVEFQCAGTLALLKNQGCAITIATMTPGDCGSAGIFRRRNRLDPAGRGLEIGSASGAEFVCLEFRDLAIVVDNPSRGKVCEALRRAAARYRAHRTSRRLHDRPRDHERARPRGVLFGLGAELLDPAMESRTAAHDDPVPVLCRRGRRNDWFGQPQPPDFIVDVTPVFELKQNMLACHESQRNWLRKQHGMDEKYLEQGATGWSAAGGRGSRRQIRRSLPPAHGPPITATTTASENWSQGSGFRGQGSGIERRTVARGQDVRDEKLGTRGVPVRADP